jgi:hypothetical protein
LSRLPSINTFESNSQIAQHAAQAASWRLLGAVSKILDLFCADIIEVCAHEPAAHVALLARQFPGLNFECTGASTQCAHGVRVLWAPDGLDARCGTEALKAYDVVVVTHPVEAMEDVLLQFDGFARVAAHRDCGAGQSLAVFGKGLRREVFRARVRTQLAA